MNYYLDTEFHEYHKQPNVLGIPVGKPIPTIDLISIGIVSDETKYIGGVDPITKDAKVQVHKHDISREYYAISKDFNIKDAWYSYQMDSYDRMGNLYSIPKKTYWLRENVLKPIFLELVEKDKQYYKDMFRRINSWTSEANPKYHIFNYKNFTNLVNKYGKSNKQIAEEIRNFTIQTHKLDDPNWNKSVDVDYPVFYAYYADYDWVVFCQLYGKMIDLPKGFPMYCNDLKQELDYKWSPFRSDYKKPKHHPDYPKQDNEHNALDDAKWNKKLHEFINKL